MTKVPQAKKGKAQMKKKPVAASSPLEAPSAGTAEAARAQPPQKARSGGGLRLVALIVIISMFGGTGYMTWPFWSHIVAPYIPGLKTSPPAKRAAKPVKELPSVQEMKTERQQMRHELSRLMARMESIEKSVETVKKMIHATARPADNATPGPSSQELSDRLGVLEKSGGEVKALIKRLDEFEKDDAKRAALAPVDPGVPADAKARALVLAVANLREVLTKGDPFQSALDSLIAIGGDDPSIKTANVLLAKNARAGIPTLASLRERFDRLAGQIVQDSKMVAEGGWMDKATNRLASLVTWRRVDNRDDAPSIDAAVARAETRLKAGDLKAAVKALEGLSGNPKAAARAEPWLRDAKARLVAERSMATLHVHAISLLAPPKG